MFIDSHCHLDKINLVDFDNNFKTLYQQIKQSKVDKMLCISINLEDYPAMYKLVENYDDIYLSCGIHPCDLEKKFDLKQLEKFARDEKVIATGECGLDYYHTPFDKTKQQDIFASHIEIAKKLNKPLVIHSRDAEKDTIALLNEQNAGDVSGIIHCFTGSYTMAKQALDLGFYISFSGIITFKQAFELRDVAKKIPLERILIETDAPYLAPTPNRGKQNTPIYLEYVAKELANLKNKSLKEIALVTTSNFSSLFSL